MNPEKDVQIEFALEKSNISSTRTRASGGCQEEPGSHRPPSLPQVGANFCRAVEGGADLQVDPSPCLSLTITNPRLSCDHGRVDRTSSKLKQELNEV